MKKHRQIFIWIAGVFLLLFSAGVRAQNPNYTLKLMNATQMSCNVYEFDLIMQRTGTTVLKLAMFQCGIKIDSTLNANIAALNGTISVSMVPNSSALNPLQRPTPEHFTYDEPNHIIRITPVSPSIANATTITNTPAGTKLCRVRVASSVPFPAASITGHAWAFTIGAGYPTKVFAYVGGVNTDITVQASQSVQASGNLTLATSYPAPTAQTVNSTITQVCQLAGDGARITLASTQSNYTYYMYVNGIAEPGAGGVVFGTGDTVSFGFHPTGGVISVVSPSCAGPVNMSNTITLVPVTPLAASVAITAAPGNYTPPNLTISSGTNVIFTATPTNGGTTPHYQWYVNGNAMPNDTLSTFSYSPMVDNDLIKCDMTSSESCVTPAVSTSITIIVHIGANAYTLSVVGGDPTYCQGTPGREIQLDSSDLGVNYTLLKNGVPQTPTVAGTGHPISFGFHTAGVYTAEGINSAGTVNMLNSVTLTETPSVPVSVTAVADQNNLCSVVPITFTANAVNGGSNPVYQWFLNSSPVGTNSSTYINNAPANHDTVRVQVTSNATCPSGSPALSPKIIVNIFPTLPVSVSIVASQTVLCQLTNSVGFVATTLNGGTSPTYQWFKNGQPVGANSSTYQLIGPTNNDNVYVVVHSSYACPTNNPDTSNPITLTVLPLLPVSVTITPDVNNICAGTPVTFTANIVNGGNPPTSIIWKKNNVPQNTYSGSLTYGPITNFVNGEVVMITIQSSEQCVSSPYASSGTTTMHVFDNLPASVTVTGPGGDTPAHHFCVHDTVVFHATPTNGGSAPTYQWFLHGNAVGTNAIYKYASPITTTDSLWVVMNSNYQCATGNPDTSSHYVVYIDPCTGIDELTDNSSVVVYPNPTNDKLYVNFGDLKEAPKSMKVFNTMGQICFQTDQPVLVNQNGIDVANMSTGTYTLQIVFEKNIVNKRFIVQ